MKKTTQNNILLAGFLDMLTTDSEGNIKEDVNSFKFHSSWDWLMPVVEKIESVGVTVEIEGHNCMISDITDSEYHQYVAHDSKINAVYVSVVAFIKWYNDNK